MNEAIIILFLMSFAMVSFVVIYAEVEDGDDDYDETTY